MEIPRPSPSKFYDSETITDLPSLASQAQLRVETKCERRLIETSLARETLMSKTVLAAS